MEEKKNKGRKIILFAILFCLIIALGIGGYWFYNNKAKKDGNSSDKVSLKDDFYDAINHDLISKATIPKDNGSWSKWYDATKTIEKRTAEITEEILNDPDFKNDEVIKVVELYTDYEGRNKRGFSELKPYFDMVDKVNTIEDYNNLIVTLDRDLAVETLISVVSSNDPYDASKNVLYIQPVGVAGVPFEIFTEKELAFFVPLIEEELKNFGKVLGYTDEGCNELVERIEAFAKKIQEKSIVTSKVTNPLDIYHKYTLSEITNEIKNVPIKTYLKKLKVDNLDFYVVPDIGHYKALDEFYTTENLPLLKEFAKIQIVANYYALTTQDNVQAYLDLLNRQNGTSMTIDDFNEKVLLSLKSELISDELQKRYEEKYFTEKDKQFVREIVADVKDYYKKVIEECDWLSEATKAEAIKKLDYMKVNVGYQEDSKEDDDDFTYVSKADGGTLISNDILLNRNEYDNFYKLFNKEADMGSMNTLEVNAYYNPLDNSINFLAGYKELYGDETDYYKLLGYLGFVIGHEISHAFDNTGSQFDENGKVNDWWTDEDKANYKELSKKIEEYYSNYEFMGIKVDGSKTLGENIADLGAMKAIVSIAESKGATKEEFKKLFEAYADLWVSKESKEYAEVISTDSHAFNKVRVNAVLSSTDKFYEVYGIKETDKMFVPKEKRVGLW